MILSPFLIKWVGIGLLTAAITAGGYSVYSNIRQAGYTEAATKYQLVIDNQQKLIDTKLKDIEQLSSTLVTESRASNTALASSVYSILNKVKGVPLVVVKDGKCTPSQTFSDTIDAVNKRVNESMKETQK